MCVNPSNTSLKKDKVAPCRGGKPYMGYVKDIEN